MDERWDRFIKVLKQLPRGTEIVLSIEYSDEDDDAEGEPYLCMVHSLDGDIVYGISTDIKKPPPFNSAVRPCGGRGYMMLK